MGKKTDIEWCDSTINLMMGCDGCELWNPKAGVEHCYAGTLHNRWAGKSKGFPESFDKPALFLHRLDEVLRWSDLTGTERPDRPWLNGLPRLIFMNDLGDTFTESLPLDWLARLLPKIATSPHVFMLLTKRPSRMREFSEKYPLPGNVWPGVSITSDKTVRRMNELWYVKGGGRRWLSVEPMLSAVEFDNDELGVIDLAIFGGESGPGARPCEVDWIRRGAEQCKLNDVACFVKQLGSEPRCQATLSESLRWPDRTSFTDAKEGTLCCPMLSDSKGGDPQEWPVSLRVRQIVRPI